MLDEQNPRLDPSGHSMIKFIKEICDDIGPRLAGSEEEHKAGTMIYNKMNEFCDETSKESYTCHPQGFLDFIWLTSLFYILGFIAYFFVHPILSLLLIIIALAIYSLQQNFLYEVIDFLFPKKTSFHVIGKIKPNRTPSQRLVLLSGHYDSAYEFPILNKLGQNSIYLIISALSISFLNILLSFIRLLLLFFDNRLFVLGDPFRFIRDIQRQISPYYVVDWLQLLLFILGSVIVIIFTFFLRSNNVVLGANDNLSAIAAVLECGGYLAKNRPEHTEVWLIAFSGEEHMRGSKRFVSMYKQELKKRHALLFNLECLSSETFLVATAEYMFLAKHSPLTVKLAKEAASKVGLSFKVGPLPFAGSDAANFSRKGLHATTLFGIPNKGIPNYWHSLEDTSDKLSGTYIAKGAEVALQFVYDVDSLDS